MKMSKLLGAFHMKYHRKNLMEETFFLFVFHHSVDILVNVGLEKNDQKKVLCID